MTDHPITPPPELVKEWATTNGTSYEDLSALCQNIAIQAARWGADQELEACCKWLKGTAHIGIDFELLHARRPKPPSLKEQALQALAELAAECYGNTDKPDTIRRALEALPE